MNNIRRVKYELNPLIETTFQVNFPTILNIEANEPAKFQDIIRNDYPIYDVNIQQQNELMVNVQGENPQAFFNSKQKKKLYSFISENSEWRVILAKDMLSLTTTKYTCWEDMFTKAEKLLICLTECYKPAYYTRVGLRYIDAIDRRTLGIEDVPWNELINPHLCGCLGYTTEEKMVVHNSTVNAEIVLDGVVVNVSSGTGLFDKKDGAIPREVFILNSDYYIYNKIPISEVKETSNLVHDRAIRFFTEAITQRLHIAMKPGE